MCLSGEHTVREGAKKREGELTCDAPWLLQPNTKVVVLGCKYDLIGRLLVGRSGRPSISAEFSTVCCTGD